jgi:hypothetical protein
LIVAECVVSLCKKDKIMLVVSTREFRDRQKSYLDKIDSGIDILLQRSNTKCYRITQFLEDDKFNERDYILAPDEELASGITAEQLLLGIKEDLREIYKKGFTLFRVSKKQNNEMVCIL